MSADIIIIIIITTIVIIITSLSSFLRLKKQRPAICLSIHPYL